ncbi:hypothetical protein [Streptomyces canus]|uniref:hypothetical protein n=1 Tax=Streptomyces canus TaxID=58343 RepID=UPI001ABFE2CF|nr:hypothetical protein [Streptomyces canus]
MAASVAGGLLAGCSSSSAETNGATEKAAGDHNPVQGASEGPSATPSALADGMGSDQEADGTFGARPRPVPRGRSGSSR